MMTRPRILMLDEPAAGLNPKETDDLKALIGVLREEHNATVLLIEHDMRLVMRACEKLVVLEYGGKIAEARSVFQCAMPLIGGARRVLGPWLILWMLASDMNEDAHGIRR